MRRIGRGATAVAMGVVALCIDVLVNVIASGAWSRTTSVIIVVTAAAVGVIIEGVRTHLAARTHVPPAVISPAPGEEIVQRPAERVEILNRLRRRRRPRAVVLYGDGGHGKSTLARSICADRMVARRYRNIYQVHCSEEMESDLAIAGLVNELIADITGNRPAHTNPETAAQHLGRALDQAGRSLLLVDDVWTDPQLAAFLTGGSRCTRLITTRRSNLRTGAGTVAIKIGPMSEAESCDLLLRGLDSSARGALLAADLPARVVGQARNWPLILNLLNRALLVRIRVGAPPEAALTDILSHLAVHGPAGAEDLHGGIGRQERSALVGRTLMAGLHLLRQDDALERLRDLAVFRPHPPVPVALAARLWEAISPRSRIEAETLCGQMAELSFVAVTERHLLLHDVMHEYLYRLLDPSTSSRLTAVLADLVVEDLADGPPDPYVEKHFAEHLVEVGRVQEAEAQLCDLRLVLRRLADSGITDLLSDLHLVGTGRTLRLAGVIERLGHVLGEEDGQVAGQFLLNALRTDPEWAAQVKTLQAQQPQPALVARWPLPDDPGEALQYVHRVPPGPWGNNPMALSPDGAWLVVAAKRNLHIVSTKTRKTIAIHHTNESVDRVAISPNGTRLATVGAGLVRVQDVTTGELVGQGHDEGLLWSIAFTSDGTMLVTTGDDGRIRLWHIVPGHQLDRASPQIFDRYGVQQIPHRGRRRRAAAGYQDWGSIDAVVTADGTGVVSAGRGIFFWSLTDGRRVAAFGEGYYWSALVEHVAVAPDGSWVAGSSMRGVDVWNTASGDHVATLGPAGAPHVLAVSADGSRLAGGSRAGSILVWDTRDFRLVTRLDGHEGLRSLHFHPRDSEHLYSSGGGEVRAWHLPKAESSEPHGLTSPVHDIVVFPDGMTAVVALTGGTVHLRAVATGHIEATLAHPGLGTVELAVAPDGTWLATAQQGTVWVWSRSGDLISRFYVGRVTGFVRSMLIPPDGQRLLTVDDLAVRAWDPRTGAQTTSMTNRMEGAESITYAQDGTWLAVGDYFGTVWVWNIPGNDLRWTLGGGYHEARSRALAVTPENTLVASTCDDQFTHWDVAQGVPISTGSSPGEQRQDRSVARTPDGSRTATVVYSEITVMDRDPGHPARTFPNWYVSALAFSPDGRHLGIACRDGVWILDTNNGARQALTADLGTTVTAVLSPGGQYLAVAGRHGVRVWDANSGRCVCVPAVGDDPIGLTFGPDGAWLAVACLSSLHIVALPSGEQLRTVGLPVTGIPRHIPELAGSPNSATLVVRLATGHLMIVDGQGDRPDLTVTPRNANIRRMMVSPDNRWLATAGNDLTVYQLADGAPVATHAVTRAITSLAWTPDSSAVLAGGAGGTYCLLLHEPPRIL